jgi:UDP-N-acetyl-D-mannosaminuronate dehydrogenase
MAACRNRFPTRGFDINPRRIADLRPGHDDVLEVGPAERAQAVPSRVDRTARRSEALQWLPHHAADTARLLQAPGPVSAGDRLPFQPDLVAGHRIGVDPCYLTHTGREIGYHPGVVLAGRRINDSMGACVADQVFKLMHRA